MIYLIVGFYWVVTGFTLFCSTSKKDEQFLELLLCLLFGGFIVPALFLKKLLK